MLVFSIGLIYEDGEGSLVQHGRTRLAFFLFITERLTLLYLCLKNHWCRDGWSECSLLKNEDLTLILALI